MQHVFVALLVVEKLGITFGEIFFKTKQFFLNFWLLRLIFVSKNPRKRGGTIFSMRFPCRGGIKHHFELFYRCFPKYHENHRNSTLIGFLTHCAPSSLKAAIKMTKISTFLPVSPKLLIKLIFIVSVIISANYTTSFRHWYIFLSFSQNPY